MSFQGRCALHSRRVIVLVSLALFGTACTQAGQTTANGAMAGTAIGAGLGAIVGSTTGDAGAGVAIGSAAGAATGALVGNAFEAQEESIRIQEEAMRRQEQQLQAQRNELDELRKLSNDSMQYKDTATTGDFSEPRARLSDPSRPVSNNQANWSKPADIQPLPSAASTHTQESSSQNELGLLIWDTDPSIAPIAKAIEVGPGYPPNLVWYNAKLEPEHTRLRAQGSSANSIPTTTQAVAANTNPGGWEPSPLNPTSVAPLQAPLPNEVPVADLPVVETLPAPVMAAATDLPEQQIPAQVVENTQNALPDAGDQSIYASANAFGANGECGEADKEAQQAQSVADSADKLFHLRKALRLCPNNASYHNRLGEVYQSLGRAEDAKFEFQEALRIDPTLTAAQNNLGSESDSSKYY